MKYIALVLMIFYSSANEAHAQGLKEAQTWLVRYAKVLASVRNSPAHNDYNYKQYLKVLAKGKSLQLSTISPKESFKEASDKHGTFQRIVLRNKISKILNEKPICLVKIKVLCGSRHVSRLLVSTVFEQNIPAKLHYKFQYGTTRNYKVFLRLPPGKSILKLVYSGRNKKKQYPAVYKEVSVIKGAFSSDIFHNMDDNFQYNGTKSF